MRPAWQRGWNFDPRNLKFYTANPGFIIGESLLGVDQLGAAGTDTALDATFTSLTINSPTTVDEAGFVHRDVETCTLTATLPAKVNLRGKWIIVKYFGTEIYRGRVAEPQITESVEVNAQHKPGNTTTKTYRVALTATNGEERLAAVATPPRTFTNQTLAQRVASWTGLSVSEQAPAADLPVGWQNAGWDTSIVRKIYRATDQLGSLLDTLRAEAKLRNMTVIYQPLKTPQVVLKPNNQWITGDGTSVLTFSDNPGKVLGQSTDPADEFVHLGRYVGYTSRTVGMDTTMYPNSVTVRWGQYDIESPPADGEPVETVSSTYRASGANGRDVVVDLGTIDVASPSSNNYRLARAVVGTIPLKGNPAPFTRELITPLQSIQQLQGTVPGMAMLEHDGIVERVAVLGREHQITPSKWLVRYTLGPPHLLDRSSDFDPGTAQTSAVTTSGGTLNYFHWVVPPYPKDATIYEYWFIADDATRLITSDQSGVGGTPTVQNVALPTGTARQISLAAGTPGVDFWVLYTSNPAIGTDNPSNLWREGQPAYLGASLI